MSGNARMLRANKWFQKRGETMGTSLKKYCQYYACGEEDDDGSDQD